MYGTLDGAENYHEARGNAGWTGTDDAKEAALLRASTLIDATYGSRFGGLPTGGRGQARAWPRTGVTDASGYAIAADEVPVEVVHATYEVALRELMTPGGLAPDYVASAEVAREKVGPLEVEYRASTVVSPAGQVMSIAGGLLAPLIGRTGGGMRMVVRA